MRTTKGIAFLGTVMLLSWAVAGATIPEAEASSTTLDDGNYKWQSIIYEKPIPQDENVESFTGDSKRSTSYYQPIELGIFSWLLFW